MIKKTPYDFLFYKTIANLPLTPSYVREDFSRMWEALDIIIERDYVLKQKDKWRRCPHCDIFCIVDKNGCCSECGKK